MSAEIVFTIIWVVYVVGHILLREIEESSIFEVILLVYVFMDRMYIMFNIFGESTMAMKHIYSFNTFLWLLIGIYVVYRYLFT
jgi:hypothetical protein